MEIPKSFDIYLNYICPKCGALHEATPKETQFPGGALCYCGKKLKYQTIDDVKVKFIFRQSQPKTIKSKPPVNDELKLAISGLVKLGLSKTAAKEMVQGKTGTAEEIIKQVFQK